MLILVVFHKYNGVRIKMLFYLKEYLEIRRKKVVLMRKI